MTTEGQGKRPRLEARLLMKRPLQFGQDARIFPGTKVMVNGARARKQSGVAGATGNRFPPLLRRERTKVQHNTPVELSNQSRSE